MLTLFKLRTQKVNCMFHRRKFTEAVGCYLRRHKKQRRILDEAYRALLGAAGGSGGNVLLTEHAIRAMGGSEKKKQNNTRRGEKKLPSPAIAPLYVFLVKFPSSMFTLIFFFPPALLRLPFSSSHLLSVRIRIQLTPTNQ